MKITVVGQCSAYPAFNQATSSYLIEGKNTKILLDLGSGALSILQNIIDPRKINSVVLSHYHPDHIADVGVFNHYVFINNLNSTIKQTINYYGLDNGKTIELNYKDCMKHIKIDTKKEYIEGDFKISFIEAKHSVPAVSMKLEEVKTGKKLVYTGDTEFTQELKEFCLDVDLLIGECTGYANENVKGHMNSLELGKLANDSNIKELIVTHLPHNNNLNLLLQEVKSQYKNKVHLAKRELIIAI